jgi:hypothetical protein
MAITLSSYPFLEFKTENEKIEYIQLERKNKALHKAIADSSCRDCGLVITEVYRSQIQQEKIYGKSTRRKSKHQVWKAIDLRSWNLSKGCKSRVLRKLRQAGFIAYIHKVKGGVNHIHVEEKDDNKKK